MRTLGSTGEKGSKSYSQVIHRATWGIEGGVSGQISVLRESEVGRLEKDTQIVRCTVSVNMSDLVANLISWGVQWIIYTALIFFMIKVQKMNYKFLGLLGSTALALAINEIPWVGRYLSYVTLLVCLFYCTRADIAPDLVFTVGIAGSLMFAVNLFLIGALMGQLRPDLKASATEPETKEVAAAEADEDETDEAQPAPAAPKPAAIYNAKDHPKAKLLALKGVAVSGRPTAMIGSGRQIYTMATGETYRVPVPQGAFKVRCDEITRSFVLLNVDGDPVKLHVR